MRIGVISDTHDRLTGIDAAMEFFKSQQVKLIIHCGDWKNLDTLKYFAEQANSYSLPVRGVLGNNDIDVERFLAYSAHAPGDFHIQEQIYTQTIGTYTLAVYHGHHRPTLNKVLDDNTYDIVLLGHSHKPRIDHSNEKLIINPGSAAFSIPRSKAWQPTVAIIETDNLSAEIHTLVS